MRSNLTVDEVVHFFSALNLKKKIEVLHELTSILNIDVKKEKEETNDATEDNIIDELFGVWKNEDNLTAGRMRQNTLLKKA